MLIYIGDNFYGHNANQNVTKHYLFKKYSYIGVERIS